MEIDKVNHQERGKQIIENHPQKQKKGKDQKIKNGMRKRQMEEMKED